MRSIVICFVVGIYFALIRGGEAYLEEAETENVCIAQIIPEGELAGIRATSERINIFLKRTMDNGHNSMTKVLEKFNLTGDTYIEANPEAPLESVLLQYILTLHREMTEKLTKEIVIINQKITKIQNIDVNIIKNKIEEIEKIIPSKDDVTQIIQIVNKTIQDKKDIDNLKEKIEEIKEMIPPKQDILRQKDLIDIKETLQNIKQTIPSINDTNDIQKMIRKMNETILDKKDTDDIKEEMKKINEKIPETKDINDIKNDIEEIKENIPPKQDINDIKDKLQTLNEIIPQKEDFNDIKVNIQTITEAISEKERQYNKPFDCFDLLTDGTNKSGVYQIYPRNLENTPVNVFCDMETGGGGWTVFLARMKQDEQVNFTRNWEDYKNGFGSPEGEYWLGNDNLHLLTSNREYTMRMEYYQGEKVLRFGEWNTFEVASEDSKYALSVSKFKSRKPITGLFDYKKEALFSTWDENNLYGRKNCAEKRQGGWWYSHCYIFNPTGVYETGDDSGIEYYNFSLGSRKLRSFAERVQMKFRPKTFSSRFSKPKFLNCI